jgi:hypothetical protein
MHLLSHRQNTPSGLAFFLLYGCTPSFPLAAYSWMCLEASVHAEIVFFMPSANRMPWAGLR